MNSKFDRPEAKKYPSVFRRDLPHIQKEGKTYFVTFTTYERRPLPGNIRDMVMKHCLKEHLTRAMVHAVVVMPDHVHLLLSPLCDSHGAVYSLSEILQSIKGASAHSINKALGRMGTVWQAESFDHILRSSESVRAKGDYLCLNPVRKGRCQSVEAYPWLWRQWVEGKNPLVCGGVAQAPPPAK